MSSECTMTGDRRSGSFGLPCRNIVALRDVTRLGQEEQIRWGECIYCSRGRERGIAFSLFILVSLDCHPWSIWDCNSAYQGQANVEGETVRGYARG